VYVGRKPEALDGKRRGFSLLAHETQNDRFL